MGNHVPAINAEQLALLAILNQEIDSTPSLFHDINRCDETDALRIAESLLQGCLFEVSTENKPGLVTPSSAGCHLDMNFFTFMQSSSTLFPCFYLSAQTGLRHSGEIFDMLSGVRAFGVGFEQRLLKSTGGVNTQRGLLFLASICAASTGYLMQKKAEITCENITETMSKIVSGICEKELRQINFEQLNRDMTISENLYVHYGITGIRGEIERGLPTVTLYGYPALVDALSKKEFSINDALLHTLLVILSYSEDSNVVWRGSVDKLSQVQALASDVLEKGSFSTERGRVAYKYLCEYCKEFNLSPGGTADLLAVTIGIYILVNGRINTSEV